VDKQFARHMGYKVAITTVGTGDKTAGLAAIRVDFVAARVDLVDRKVSFAAVMVVGKDLATHKVIVECKVAAIPKATVGKFLAESAEFRVGTDKF